MEDDEKEKLSELERKHDEMVKVHNDIIEARLSLIKEFNSLGALKQSSDMLDKMTKNLQDKDRLIRYKQHYLDGIVTFEDLIYD